MSEYLHPFLRRRKKELQEVALCNHCNLAELIPVYSDDIPYRGIDILNLSHNPAVRICELRTRDLLRGAGSPLVRSFVLRVSLYSIFLAVVAECELDLSRRAFIRILGTEHRRLPVAAAWTSVQRVGYRVENRGFARARIACNQIDSAGPQLLEVEKILAGVWAER